MANILTDPTATFEAADVWAATKINNTARLPADAEFWVIAQWANEIDDQLKALNSMLLGESSAGSAGTSIDLLGSLVLAENFSAAGDAQIGDYAAGARSVEIKNSGAGAGSLKFGISGDTFRGGLSYDHANSTLSALADGSSRLEVLSSAVRPTAHNITKLGDSSHRWAESHTSQLFAREAATVGGLSQAVELKIDGGGALAIPSIVFAHAGATQATIDAPDTGELRFVCSGPARFSDVDGGVGIPVLTTAERLALTAFDGLVAYDSDLDEVFFYGAGSWSIVGIDTLAQTLAAGNVTGGFDIEITNADSIVGEDAGSIAFQPTTGAVKISPRAVVGDTSAEVDGIDFAGGTVTSNLTISQLGAGNTIQASIHRHSTSEPPSLAFFRSHSDTSAHTIVSNGDKLANVCGAGWDGADYALGGCFGLEVSGTPGAGDMPTKFFVSLSADGSESPTDRLVIEPDGVATLTGDLLVSGDVPLPVVQRHGSYDAYLNGSSPSLVSRGGSGFDMPALNYPDPSTQVNYAYWFSQVPQTFDGNTWSINMTIWFAQNAGGAGNITWSTSFDRIETGILSTANSFDADGPEIVTVAASGTQYEIQSTTIPIPYSKMDGVLAGELLFFKIQTSTTGDTFTGGRDLYAAQLEYIPPAP